MAHWSDFLNSIGNSNLPPEREAQEAWATALAALSWCQAAPAPAPGELLRAVSALKGELEQAREQVRTLHMAATDHLCGLAATTGGPTREVLERLTGTGGAVPTMQGLWDCPQAPSTVLVWVLGRVASRKGAPLALRAAVAQGMHLLLLQLGCVRGGTYVPQLLGDVEEWVDDELHPDAQKPLVRAHQRLAATYMRVEGNGDSVRAASALARWCLTGECTALQAALDYGMLHAQSLCPGSAADHERWAVHQLRSTQPHGLGVVR